MARSPSLWVLLVLSTNSTRQNHTMSDGIHLCTYRALVPCAAQYWPGVAFTNRSWETLGGALFTDPADRNGLIRLLDELERDHSWPTSWITTSLKDEWGMAGG